MDKPVVGRLAPSPTGALHLGNARSFLLAWLSVRQQGGRLILRIEDIDSPRVKPWAIESTIEDLLWLGLDWDFAPESGYCGAAGQVIPLLQTMRLDHYASHVRKLVAERKIYVCTCTRSEVESAASAPHEAGSMPVEGTVYSGKCRGKAIVDSESLGNFAYRWAFDAGVVEWWDRVYGVQRADPLKQLGDFVVARSSGVPAYQLAVVVDDHEQDVTEVVRGNDLIYSTFRQLAIYEHFGWSPPLFVHVPLIVGPDGRRLAKRHGDTRLRWFREQGVTPEALLGYLAWTLGLTDTRDAISAPKLIGKLDWDRIPRETTVFDLEKEMPALVASS